MLLFIFAAFDTTYSSMIGVILNMCRFPDVQEKVHEKIREVLGPGAFKCVCVCRVSFCRFSDALKHDVSADFRVSLLEAQRKHASILISCERQTRVSSTV